MFFYAAFPDLNSAAGALPLLNAALIVIQQLRLKGFKADFSGSVTKDQLNLN